MKTKFLAFMISCCAMLGGCHESDAPEPARVQLNMKASTSLSKINSAGRKMAGGLVFSEIMIGVTEIEFETLEENQQEEEDAHDGQNHDGELENEDIEFEGAFAVDLIRGTSMPDFGTAEILPGLYEELEIEIGPVLEGGKSVFIAFEIPRQDAEPIKFEYSYSGELEIEIERDGGFHLDGGALNQMLVLFDLDMLFGSIDFSQAVADADGVVRINSASNAHIASLIETNFQSVFEAGEDHDGDHHIDED